MSDFWFIFTTILVVTALIYFSYRFVLDSKVQDEHDLQITPREIFEQLSILYNQRKYNIVESLAKKYLVKKPFDYDVRFIYAKSLRESRGAYDAVEQGKFIISKQPKNTDVRVFLADCYEEIDKPLKAINLLQDVLNYDPENVYVMKLLARLLYETNQKISAIKMYQRYDEFLDNGLEKAKNKAFIAQIHLELREYEEAISEYEEILEMYPEDISVKKELVHLYCLMQEFDSAATIAAEILEISEDSNKLWAIQQLMQIHHAIKDYEKALYYADLMKVHPLSNEIEVGCEIANILKEEGNVDASIELLKELISKDADNVNLKKSLANSYQAINNYGAAEKIYNEILDTASVLEIERVHYELSNLYANWALYYFEQEDSAECFKLFTTAIKYNEKNPDVYYKLGGVNKAIKNFNEAISQYKKALELDNQNPKYYWELSECYEEIDSPYEQKKILLESLKHSAVNPNIHYKLGRILQIQNDSQGAIAHYKKAIELDESFIDAKKHLGLLYEHLAKADEAIKIYEEILEIEPDNQEIQNNLKMLKK